jgi:hypothetical protein
MLRTEMFIRIFTVVWFQLFWANLISSLNLPNHSNRSNSPSDLITVIGSIRVWTIPVNTKAPLRNSRRFWKEKKISLPLFKSWNLIKVLNAPS